MELLYINTYERHEIGSVGTLPWAATQYLVSRHVWIVGICPEPGTYCT